MTPFKPLVVAVLMSVSTLSTLLHAADSSTSNPLLPALTKIVANGCAVSSINVRKRFFCPNGLTPPST